MAVAAEAVSASPCLRCGKLGHTHKECPRPMMRTHTIAELRQVRFAEKQKAAERAAKREEERAAWEEKRAKESAAWELRQAKRAQREAARSESRSESVAASAPPQAMGKAAARWSDMSDVSDETESTYAPSVWEQDDIKRVASNDKEVRKLEKKLRDMEKLEKLEKLDHLQKQKLAGKAQLVIDLDTARGLAEARARDSFRTAMAAALI
eukprot:TRINITY_DN14236_c0_g1_i1.p1 TRINITY_DN14236_c0_g1~~TRINITY_DN14236_c0_g1_i1.p1  ORF type:complete len:228 (+),score=51.51 TRINITY_DN14236_c0_g1_i1:58-684(+)